MIKKFVGEITLENSVPKMPTDQNVPDKKEWNHLAVWNFNGKVWNPASKKAEENLDEVVKNLESQGYRAARKPGKRKPSSLKYAIKTTGVEDFEFVK